MWGARDGNLASVEVLLAAGADTRPTNALGRDAFLLAAAGGQPQTIDMFLARGADVNAVDKNGTTALMMATPTPAAVIGVASPELERARRETAALLRAVGGTE